MAKKQPHTQYAWGSKGGGALIGGCTLTGEFTVYLVAFKNVLHSQFVDI